MRKVNHSNEAFRGILLLGQSMSTADRPRTVIRIEKSVIGPELPRTRTVRVRHLADYPHVSAPHLWAAKRLSSPLLMGPPICDELLAFVQHTFSEEEADVVRVLRPLRGRTAIDIASKLHKSPENVQEVLDRLALQKRAISCSGPTEQRQYRLIPIMPGMFEMVLIGQSPATLTDWHRRFAELFEALFETGYTLDYQERQTPLFRFLPVGRVAGNHPMALPADHLEVVLDRFKVFGVGHCQCRMSSQPTGVGCGRPLLVCTAMGEWATQGIAAGSLQRVSRQNVLEIKREAESHGLVTWIMNVESTAGQASCSCCGCCCKAMRMVNEFNAPGMMAPPHFMPRFDGATCTHCGRCAKACPMGAITVHMQQKTLQHDPARCIGCGLCQVACEQRQAVRMEPVPEYRVPYKSWYSLLLRNAPSMLRTSWRVWRRR
jgi:Pyruvate/2-oxoacid:ferredoxin oxidoreductase delta subunit